jgi:hypothetical protein
MNQHGWACKQQWLTQQDQEQKERNDLFGATRSRIRPDKHAIEGDQGKCDRDHKESVGDDTLGREDLTFGFVGYNSEEARVDGPSPRGSEGMNERVVGMGSEKVEELGTTEEYGALDIVK